VEVQWRSLFRSTSLEKRCTSYNAPPTFRKHTENRWSLWNFLPRSSLSVVGKAQKSQGARSGLYGGCSNGVPPIHFFQVEDRIQFRSRPMRFLRFSNHEKGVSMQEISNWSTVCSTFSRNGWSVVRSSSLANGGTSKKRTSPHLHKFRLGLTRWVHEPFKRPSYLHFPRSKHVYFPGFSDKEREREELRGDYRFQGRWQQLWKSDFYLCWLNIQTYIGVSVERLHAGGVRDII
jgi:hypothetical protein